MAWVGCFTLLLRLLPVDSRAEALRAQHGLVWEAAIDAGASNEYAVAVDQLLARYEETVGVRLQPGERGQVALKVDTRSGPGLSTPVALLRAVINSLERRSFSRDSILIVGPTASGLRRIGLIPPLSQPDTSKFDGCEVIAWDSNMHQDADWFYDSPLPSTLRAKAALLNDWKNDLAGEQAANARKSFLPVPLLFEVDFWINFATGVDAPALGVDGALAGGTLWNVTNSRRFLGNAAAAAAAVAEIAAIPELAERWILNFVSLAKYQYIGGPAFNAAYTRSEAKLWLSSDPVALDRLLYDRINRARRFNGFPEISPLPPQLLFAASLGLGVYQQSQIRIQVVSENLDAAGARSEINELD